MNMKTREKWRDLNDLLKMYLKHSKNYSFADQILNQCIDALDELIEEYKKERQASQNETEVEKGETKTDENER